MTKINLLSAINFREWPKSLSQSIPTIDWRIKGIITLALAGLVLIAIRMLRHIPALSLKPQSDPLPDIAFGAAQWKKYIGDVGVEPPLPPDIEEILSAPCPFFPDRKVRDTHLLVLVPATVNCKPLNIKHLGDIVKKPLCGQPIKCGLLNTTEYTDPCVPKSHWILMTRGVVRGSVKKTFTEQKALIEAKLHYEMPNFLDATICILMKIIRTGKTSYSYNHQTKHQIFTRCSENDDNGQRLIVGNGSTSFLVVGNCCDDFSDESIGVGGLRKL